MRDTELMVGAFYNPHLGAELAKADGIDHLAMADPPAATDPWWPAIRERYTLLLHDYLGQLSEPLDERSIARARALAELYGAPWVDPGSRRRSRPTRCSTSWRTPCTAARGPAPSRSTPSRRRSRRMRCSGASSGSGRPCEDDRRAAAGARGRRRIDRGGYTHPHPLSGAHHQWPGYRRDAGAGADDGRTGPGFVRGGASLPARQGAGGRVEGGRALRPPWQAGARLRLPRGASRALARDERRARHARVRQARRAQRFRARVERQDIGRGCREETRAGGCGGGGRPRRHTGRAARGLFAGASRAAGT